jgi:ribonuclease H / adenosylcobalamin/alpha-ribazole phosphatase
VRTLILARHGEAASNEAGTVSGTPPGQGLTRAGIEQARLLADAAARERVDLGVATEFLRAQQTLELALDGRAPTMILPELNEIRFGDFDGGPLAEYRVWAWTEPPDVHPPGDGESRAEVAARVAAGLDVLLAREENTILAVAHALPVRYVLDAADGRVPTARIEPVAHAVLYGVDAAGVARGAETLRAWSRDAVFRLPIG